MAAYVAVGVLFVVCGVLLFLKPEVFWELTEKWKSNRADEPSDLYVFSAKAGGIVFVLIGIAAVIVPWIPDF